MLESHWVLQFHQRKARRSGGLLEVRCAGHQLRVSAFRRQLIIDTARSSSPDRVLDLLYVLGDFISIECLEERIPRCALE